MEPVTHSPTSGCCIVWMLYDVVMRMDSLIGLINLLGEYVESLSNDRADPDTRCHGHHIAETRRRLQTAVRAGYHFECRPCISARASFILNPKRRVITN